jgi:hypothetical protein
MRQGIQLWRKLDLPQLAKRYIQGSNSEIRTVIRVNLNDIYKAKQGKGAKTALANETTTFLV